MTTRRTTFPDPQSLREAKARVVAEHGPWSTPIDLGFGINACDVEGADSSEGTRLPRILRVVEDLTAGKLSGLRILDLGCLEGMVAVELAIRGATVLGIEAREPNLARARFAGHALGLESLDFVHDDVRNLRAETHGSFDLTLCLGVLYHLPEPDVFAFIERLHEVTRRAAVIDTHVGLPNASRALLGPMRTVAHAGRTYRGRDYREFEADAGREDRLKAVWSSVDDRPSFWPTQGSLFNLLAAAGFTSVLEVRKPVWRGMPDDRLMLVAFRGEPIEGPAFSGRSPEPFPEG